MRYFRMDFDDFVKASEEVWRRQDDANVRHTSFGVNAYGSDASICVSDTYGQELFRKVLNEKGIQFTESDKNQVNTWLSDAFGGF